LLDKYIFLLDFRLPIHVKVAEKFANPPVKIDIKVYKKEAG